ncbi:sequence-specific DNA binding transcription factor ATNDX [Wolffia australiana]
MARWAEEPGGLPEQNLNFFCAVEELDRLSSLELGKLLQESENFELQFYRDGSLVQIDVEKLALSLPLHLLAVLLANDGCDLVYFIRGMRVLYSLFDLASRHVRLEQILLEEVKVTEQALDLVFYLLLVLAAYGQGNSIDSAVLFLHPTLVANSFHLLTVLISSQWQELVQVLVAHPKVDVFMDAAFDAVQVDIRFLRTKLLALNDQVSSYEEKVVKHICLQCEASLQFILFLCQQKMFRDRLLSNKELCRHGGILSLASKILDLGVPQCLEYSTEIAAAISRLKSKVLSILLQLCEAENVSYLDEVAASEKSMNLAKSVVLEILDQLKAAFCVEVNHANYYPVSTTDAKGLVVLNSLRLADIFSDDSNFRSFFMSNITRLLADILAMPREEFFPRWCSAEVPMMEDDAVLEYDPLAGAAAALTFYTGAVECPFGEPVLQRESSFSCPPNSYAPQRISYLVKIIANLHCFVPDLCEEEEMYLFLHKFLECLRTTSSDVQRAATICENLGSFSVYAESLVPNLLNDEDVQLLSDFYKQILQSNSSPTVPDYPHG